MTTRPSAPAPRTTQSADAAKAWSFGAAGNARAIALEGWSTPEQHYTWSTGPSSTLRIPALPGAGALMLEMSLIPMLAVPIIRAQRLTVLVHGQEVGAERLAGDCTLCFVIPDDIASIPGPLAITLLHPDAVAPSELGLSDDTRALAMAARTVKLFRGPPEPAFTPRSRPPLPTATPATLAEAVRGCTALTPRDLVMQFESLGHNCEFGFMQRSLGAEPLGLLRFGGKSLHNLLRGLQTGFEGIANPAKLRVYTEHNRGREEYLVRDDHYGVQFHTGIMEDDATPDEVRRKMSVHLAFLRRNFMEKLATGQNIFVLHDPGCVTLPQVRPVLNALRAHGPNALLYVTEKRHVPPGGVTQEKPDLFHGVTNLLPTMQEASNIQTAAWLSICANAYRMWRESGFGA